jgi:retron-type reverse transcriptase
MWDGITRVIKMDSKVENLAATMVDQQKRIEDLTGRIIRLETALEIALVSHSKNIGKKINKYQPSKRTIRKPSSST